jgi:hypothetical protein
MDTRLSTLGGTKLTSNMLELHPRSGAGMQLRDWHLKNWHLKGWRLNGWMRIGIILSVLWMLGGTGYLWQTPNNDGLSIARALLNQRSSCIGDNAVLRMEGKPELPCPSQTDVNEAFARSHTGLGSALLITGTALVLAWVAIGLVCVTTRWVMQGFKPEH